MKKNKPIDLENDLDWNDISTEGFPREGEKIIVDVRMIQTGTVVYDKSFPPKAKFVFDKEHVLKDTRYSYLTEDEMEKIQKEYW